MYLKSIMIIVATAILISGCNPIYRTYSGQILPEDKVAFLECKTGVHIMAALYITEIDGKAVTYTNWDGSTRQVHLRVIRVELTPGEHTISFMPRDLGSNGKAVTKDINFEADRTYAARMKTYNGTSYHPYGNYRTTVYEANWDVEISQEK